MKAKLVTLFAAMLVLGLLLAAGSVQAKMILWYGKKPSHSNFWWNKYQYTNGMLPTGVKTMLKRGYTIYWVECRDNSCNSALREVQRYHQRTNQVPDWRFKVK